MTLHFLALMLLALCIAAGFLYRAAILMFALGFTYFFLLDRTNYQNHYYLLMLISWTLALLPLKHYAAVDATKLQVPHSDWVPAWCLAVRFHVALPYAFGRWRNFAATGSLANRCGHLTARHGRLPSGRY
jgi:hypothetical protein